MFNLRNRIALVPAALALSGVPALRDVPRAEGWAITAEMRTSADSQKLVLTFKFVGEKMRLDPDLASMGPNDPAAAQMMVGAFLLAQPGGKVAFVMPSMGVVMRMNANEMNAPDSTSQKCESVVLEDLGAGEAILGIATRKFRMRTRLQAKGDRPAGEEVQEAWVATSMPGSDGAFKRFAKSFGDQVGGGDCPDQLATFPEGFPLRMKSTKPGPNGAETEDMQVTSVKKQMFTDADFVIPPGMRVVDGNPFGKD